MPHRCCWRSPEQAGGRCRRPHRRSDLSFRGGAAASIVVGRDLRLMMFLKYAVSVLLALAGTSGWPMSATAQSVLKIGVINSYSGFLAQAGDEMGKGIDLYAKDHEKDLPSGVKVELIRRDDAAAPETGKRVAQELITRDHVQLLVGVVSSPVAAAIAPLTAEAKVPFIITNAAGVAIPRLSPYVVRVSFTQWHTA